MSNDERVYIKGNEAMAIGALHAGVNAYFAYPITPSSEVPETFASEFVKTDEKSEPIWPDFKVFMQSASEIEAINMTIGAACTGVKSMTFTASPGFSLKQEGISYAVGMEVPFVLGNVNRGGPGLGNLGPEQTDYFQAVKGGGHGGYKLIVLAPAGVQEIVSFPAEAFDLAFKYRQPVIILLDAFTGQIKEDVVFPEIEVKDHDTSWATTGAKGREYNVLNSLYLDLDQMEERMKRITAKWKTIEENEVRYEEYKTEDAELVIVAFGIMARLLKAAINRARDKGHKVGLIRPITLWPFPTKIISEIAAKDTTKSILVGELNAGQMIEDVKLAVDGRVPVELVFRMGGNLPNGEMLDKAIKEAIK